MVDPVISALREAARHRGYRLLVSKKRTPGVGDYGKFGLASSAGEPLLGVAADGLTASVADIEAFLRDGEIKTWKESARALPAHATPSIPKPPRASRANRTAGTPAKKTVPTGKPRPRASVPVPAKHTPAPDIKARAERPSLRIRKASATDGNAIARLLGSKSSSSVRAVQTATRMANFAKAGSGLLVAEQGGVIGCLAWSLVPALHRPPVGRIATLVVAEAYRRAGIGRALVEEAERQCRKAGGERLEVMSDIDIASAHGFFRKLGFEETSYRFAKQAAERR